MTPQKILVVFGTRPEAIKMAPVITRLYAQNHIETHICVTAQHRNMLDQALQVFGIQPDYDLGLMRPHQTLPEVTSAVLTGVTRIVQQTKPDTMLVHGDTTTAFAAALAGFYARVRVAHVEAGLRSGNLQAPWPEEMNRRSIAPLAAWHFAPTPTARTNLQAEGIAPQAIWVTGNTVIDALQDGIGQLASQPQGVQTLITRMPWLSDTSRRMVLVTGHRRENFDAGLSGLCKALIRLVATNPIRVVYPVHPNPQVREPVHRLLNGVPHMHLIEPLEYLPFLYLMQQAYCVITDSGGIQEEAPSLGKPVLLVRQSTERPEAVAAGTVRLVGTDADRIVEETQRLLDDPSWYARMATAHNPYGDGQAADRIVQILQGKVNIHEFA